MLRHHSGPLPGAVGELSGGLSPEPNVGYLDEFLINLAASEELTHAGHDVVSAYSADEAIELLETASDIDLIDADIDIPGSMDPSLAGTRAEIVAIAITCATRLSTLRLSRARPRSARMPPA